MGHTKAMLVSSHNLTRDTGNRLRAQVPSRMPRFEKLVDMAFTRHN